MIDLTPRKESLKRRLARAFLRLMVRWHVMSPEDGTIISPPPLKGNTRWVFRAWMYGPIPIVFGLLLTRGKFDGTPIEALTMRSLLALAVLGFLFICYRHDRRRMPTLGEGCAYLLWTTYIGIFQVVIHVILDRRFELSKLTYLLVMPALALVTMPLSLVLIDEQKRNKAKRSKVKA